MSSVPSVLKRYSQRSIALSPLPPDTQCSNTEVLPGVALSEVGASGTLPGVALATALSAPTPTKLRARTWQRCSVLLGRCSRVKLVACASPGALSAIGVNNSLSSAPSVVQRNSQDVIAAPPSPPDTQG